MKNEDCRMRYPGLELYTMHSKFFICLAASPGFAPGPPVSETGALLITPRGPPPRSALWRGTQWLAEPKPWRRLVARKGSAPSISGCRPDVMLFHHQAENGSAESKLTGESWLPRLDSHQDRRGQSPICCCYTTRQEMVEPEVVATSPNRIKSPVPVCCGFDSVKLVGERGLASRNGGTHRLSICGVCYSRFTSRVSDERSTDELRPRKWCPQPGFHQQPDA